MTVHIDGERTPGEGRSYRYFRNAVERHWDPHDIDLSEDRVRIARLDDRSFDQLRRTLALFGAGEEAVTEDLAPLAVVLEDVNDQMFVASQTYEEAKHADFFDRYWTRVIDEEAHARGNDPADPTDDRWFGEDYVELFDRTEAAMERLLTEDTPETRAAAYCHYHLVVEGVLAQTGYYGVQNSFSGEVEGLPRLPGLVEGFSKVRADEGRHVGFGMAKLKDLVQSGAITAEFISETVGELVELTQGIVATASDEDAPGANTEEMVAYAAEKHRQRMRQITEADAEIPDVERLVALDD
ncbi:ribonucleoside-diphosphate reductase [Halobacteriales archaeon QS_8_69_26]|nr:MAG: ribonucleoside-diphosphate reductase [Halobacteriales archaeon QS_8_69_26]